MSAEDMDDFDERGDCDGIDFKWMESCSDDSSYDEDWPEMEGYVVVWDLL